MNKQASTRPAYFAAAVTALAVVSLSIALPQLRLEERVSLFVDVYAAALIPRASKREE